MEVGRCAVCPVESVSVNGVRTGGSDLPVFAVAAGQDDRQEVPRVVVRVPVGVGLVDAVEQNRGDVCAGPVAGFTEWEEPPSGQVRRIVFVDGDVREAFEETLEHPASLAHSLTVRHSVWVGPCMSLRTTGSTTRCQPRADSAPNVTGPNAG